MTDEPDDLEKLVTQMRKNPEFERLYQIEKEREKRLVETECRFGNCIEERDPEDPEYFSSVGPVLCPCQGERVD